MLPTLSAIPKFYVGMGINFKSGLIHLKDAYSRSNSVMNYGLLILKQVFIN